MAKIYEKYEGSSLWLVIEKIVQELEDNTDLKLTTTRAHIIGYFCKRLLENKNVLLTQSITLDKNSTAESDL